MGKSAEGERAAGQAPEAAKGAAKVPTPAELRAAIPKECFQYNLAYSFFLVIRDAVVMAAIFLMFTSLLRVPGGPDGPLAAWEWAGWAVYGFAMGTAAVGWWVLAHECGHGGFSQYKVLNDAVGWVLHSLLLVPYFSWQYSHAKHHANTNHLMNGETHVPDTEDELRDLGFLFLHRAIGDSCYAAFQLVAHLVFGWPTYLFFNVTGGRRLNGAEVSKPVPVQRGGVADHFRPNSALFPDHWRVRIGLSTFGILLTLIGLACAVRTYGFAAVMVVYGVPYLWTNFWLVLYTWLQHTDQTIPHYGDEDFTWIKGALCTIDRPYGIFDWMHHHIGSTHVCHHVFSYLPCYHAVEATKHLKAYLEPRGLYNYDPTPIPLAAWRAAKTCHYVDDVHGTQYYKTIGSRPKAQ